ncbi:hypothetical protein [Saccharopolyspora hattusasensis]|uniref:hypothetical protein n=1 Tax=Saccharopolyspora hattusasensis TaxID=1128679 RepID=UPI003D95EDA8
MTARRNRTAGQPVAIYLGVEKDALARWWNPASYEAILEAEDHDRDQLNAQ